MFFHPVPGRGAIRAFLRACRYAMVLWLYLVASVAHANLSQFPSDPPEAGQGEAGVELADLDDAVQGLPVCPYAALGPATRCLRGYGVTSRGHLHTGYDMGGVPAGTPILSATSGRVIFSGYVAATGWTVVVQDERGYGHLYGHMGLRSRHGSARHRPPGMVRRDLWVQEREPLGPVGNTGRIHSRWKGPQAGTHLHYALVPNDPLLLQAIEAAGRHPGRHLGVTFNEHNTLAALPLPPELHGFWAHASLGAGALPLLETAHVITAGEPSMQE